jgi:hypothetical protein
VNAWGDIRPGLTATPAGYAATAVQFLDEAAQGDERDLAVRQLAALQGIGYGLLAVAELLDDANDAAVQCAQSVDELRAAVRELRDQLDDALERIAGLEKQTPQARQLQLEADLATADFAASGYRYDEYGPPAGAGRHGRNCQCPYCYVEPEEEPPVVEYDPGPEVDDEGGMSEYRYHEPEPWQ